MQNDIKKAISIEIRDKVKELNQLIEKGNKQNLSVHILQSNCRTEKDKVLYSSIAVNIYETVEF